MACGNGCNGYYQCGCDIINMKKEIKQMAERTELLQYRIKDRVAEFNQVNEGKATMTA